MKIGKFKIARKKSLMFTLEIFLLLIIISGCNQGQVAAPLTLTPTNTLSEIIGTPTFPSQGIPSTPTISTPTPTPTPTTVPTTTPLPSVGGQSAGDPYIPALGNTGYDVLHYTLKLSLSPGQTLINASAIIDAVSGVHNLTEFSLDFAGFEITSVSIDGVAVRYEREEQKLLIYPFPSLSNQQLFSIQVDYKGSPLMESSDYIPFMAHLGLQFMADNIFAISEPDGAHYWFPGNDHPSDKATFRFELTVPSGYSAVANGVLVDEIPQDGGKNTFIWEHNYPMATYLAIVAVGNYERIDSISPNGIPIHDYVFPDLIQNFREEADITGEVLDWMSDNFGPYPFETFGFVTIRQITSSLETQSMVTLSEQMLDEETIVHEIIHMWFGDWVSMESWADMWNNEGFATYISLMWQTRDHPEDLYAFMDNHTTSIIEKSGTDPLGDLPPHKLFGYASYQKGAVFIHTIRLTIGDDAFFEGLRNYLELFGGGTASREDFQRVMEEASGLDLNALFEEWLE